MEVRLRVDNNSGDHDPNHNLTKMQRKIYSYFESMIPSHMDSKETIDTTLENVTRLVVNQFKVDLINSWQTKQDFSKLGRIQHSNEQVYNDKMIITWFLNSYWDLKSIFCKGNTFELRLTMKPLSLKLVLLKNDVLHQMNHQLGSPQKMQEMKQYLSQEMYDTDTTNFRVE